MADVFDQSTNTGIDENVDYMAELVGDGKKFKTPQELAKGKAMADQHIANLERSLAELREDLNKRATTDDLLTEVRRIRTETPPQSQNTNTEPEDKTQTSLTREEVAQMLAERDAGAKQAQNLTSAVQKLTDMYGNDVAKEIDNKAKELGVTRDYLREMAKVSPSVFTALFTPRQKDVFGTPPGSNRNTGASVSTSHLGKYSDFQKVRRENPKEYHSVEFQKRMLEAADRAAAANKYDEWRNS